MKGPPWRFVGDYWKRGGLDRLAHLGNVQPDRLNQRGAGFLDAVAAILRECKAGEFRVIGAK